MKSSLASAFEPEPAFIPYLVAGDPSFEESMRYVEALEAGGADAIELGLPFSDPIAEGPTIQAAIGRALEAGMTPTRYFSFVEQLSVDIPLVCMTYYNLVLQYGETTGPEAFVTRAAEAGIAGLVIPDLPYEEARPLQSACEAAGLDLVFIVAPTTTDERLRSVRDRASGYVYVQARLGTTGAKTDVSDRTAASLERLSDWDVPLAVGFGISTGAQAEEVVAAGADGVIVGSALVDIIASGIDDNKPTDAIATDLSTAAREFKDGAVAGSPAPRTTDK